MNFQSAGYQLLPVLPELVLAVGAMALLMLGAYRGEGATRARLSLARTAELLFAHRGDAAAGRYTPPGEADLSEGVEATSWGSARRLWPPMQVGGAPMAWALPAGALGRHEAAWA